MPQNKTIQLLTITTFLLLLVTGSPVFANSTCPDVGYTLEGGSRDGRICFYENEIILGLHGASTPEDCFSSMYKKYIWGNHDPVELDQEGEVIWLHSQTHASQVSIHVNTEEFTKKRRSFWLQKAKEYLKQAESWSVHCKSPEMTRKFNSEFAPVSSPEIKVQKDSPPETSLQKTRALDSWDAPSPKAKIPE